MRKGLVKILAGAAIVASAVIGTAKAAAIDDGEPRTKHLPIAAERPLTVKQRVGVTADKYNLDKDLFHCIAEKESGYNPSATNSTSSAGGVFQFINSTWKSTVQRMGKTWTMEDKFAA